MRTNRWRVLGVGASIALLAGCGGDHPSDAGEAATGEATPWFEELGPQSGVVFRHDSGHAEDFLIPEIVAGGVAVLDMDADGDLDLYLVQSGSIVDGPGPAGRNALYENQGDGRFVEVTAGSGADDPGYGMGAATGDVDNDGDVDLLVTNLGRNTLLLNDGTGRFTDVTEASGLLDEDFSASATFFDADNDGDLDLFVTNYLIWSPERETACVNSVGQEDYCAPTTFNSPALDRLYLNDGAGRFTDRSRESGIAMIPGTGLGVVAMDMNSDGLQDVFVANDAMPDRLWLNQGDGRFVEEALRYGCATDSSGKSKAGMGIATGDLNRDGHVDLMVCNLWKETDSLFLIDERGNFRDATIPRGLAVIPKQFTRFGLGFYDFDNDGHLDLYEANGRVARRNPDWGDDPYGEPNVVFRGTADGRFEEILPRSATKVGTLGVSRGAAFGDFDNDGGIDVVVLNRDGPPEVLRNVVPDRGNWVKIRVVDRNGRDAHGAEVTVRAGDAQWTDVVQTDGSYLAASDPRLHFGLGSSDVVDAVEIRWPDGTREDFGPQEVNVIRQLRQGAAPPASASGTP